MNNLKEDCCENKTLMKFQFTEEFWKLTYHFGGWDEEDNYTYTIEKIITNHRYKTLISEVVAVRFSKISLASFHGEEC